MFSCEETEAQKDSEAYSHRQRWAEDPIFVLGYHRFHWLLLLLRKQDGEGLRGIRTSFPRESFWD